MIEWLKNCSTKTSDKKIVVEENKRKFVIENPEKKEIIKIQIDDCLMIEGKRCDWLFELQEKGQYFVELKGKDINRAFEQLENTLNVFKEKKLLKSKIVLVIILSQYPKITTKVQRWKKKLSKKFKAEFEIKNKKFTVEI